MTENLHSGDTERVSPTTVFAAAQRKHLGFLSPLSFSSHRTENPTLVCAFQIYLIETTFGRVGVVRGTKTWNYFISSVRKYFTAKIQF